MTRVAVPAGVPIAVAGRRLRDSTPGMGAIGADALAATSTWPNATATADATPHTKGAWTEVIAATAEDYTWLYLQFTSNIFVSNGNSSTLLDIGVGAAGSEEVIVPDLGAGYRPSNTPGYSIPVFIPKGSRVAVRAQSVVASQQVPARYLFGRHAEHRIPARKLLNLNANAATSRGTDLTTPTSADTKTDYVAITASCPQALSGIVVCAQGAGSTFEPSDDVLVDIAIGPSGAASTQVDILRNLPFQTNSSELIIPMCPSTWDVDIPAGAPIAARWQASQTSQRMDLTILGIPAT